MHTKWFCWLALMCGCSKPAPARIAPASSAANAPAITTIQPVKRAIQRIVEQPGSVQAFQETTLYAKFPGFVQSLSADPAKAKNLEYDRFIDIGSRVKKDQPLAVLAVPELEQEFQQKEAVVRQADAEVVQAQKAVLASQANVTAAEAHIIEAKAGINRAQAVVDRWKSESERSAKLAASGVVDAQTREETENQYKAAQAAFAESKAKVSTAEAMVKQAEANFAKSVADVSAMEAKRDVAKADVRRVEALKSYLKIVAPFDGIITKRGVNIGDYVSADAKNLLFMLARIDPVRVVVQVPEAEAGFIQEGQEATITLQNVAGPALKGKVVRSSWSLEPGSRTLHTEVDLPNADGSLRPGMYVMTKFVAELPEGFSIPAAALGKINDEPVMYLVEGGKAVRVLVQPYRGDAKFTQIRKYKKPSASDWTEITGEEKIASPAASISDGQEVK